MSEGRIAVPYLSSARATGPEAGEGQLKPTKRWVKRGSRLALVSAAITSVVATGLATPSEAAPEDEDDEYGFDDWSSAYDDWYGPDPVDDEPVNDEPVNDEPVDDDKIADSSIDHAVDDDYSYDFDDWSVYGDWNDPEPVAAEPIDDDATPDLAPEPVNDDPLGDDTFTSSYLWSDDTDDTENTTTAANSNTDDAGKSLDSSEPDEAETNPGAEADLVPAADSHYNSDDIRGPQFFDMFGTPHKSSADAQVTDVLYEASAQKANVELGLPSDGVVTHEMNDVPTGFYQTPAGAAFVGGAERDKIIVKDDELTVRSADSRWKEQSFNLEEIVSDPDDRESIAIIGNGGNDQVFVVGSGANTIVGGVDGDDILPGSGDNTVFAGPGRDRVHGGSGDDIIFGGSGSDEIYPGAGNDFVDAGDGDDLIDENQYTNAFSLGGRDDTLRGGLGNDTIRGGSGDDEIDGGDGVDVLEGDRGNDTILAGSGNDLAFGGKGNDRIVGFDGNDLLMGNQGNDFVFGGAGDDVMYGGDGEDQLNGNDGNDYADGGEDDDAIRGHDGDDILTGGLDNDTFDGGAGSDVLIANAGAFDVIVDSFGEPDGDLIYISKWLDRYPGFSDDTIIQIEHQPVLAEGQIENRIEDPYLAERVESDLETLRSIPSGQEMLTEIELTNKWIELTESNEQYAPFVKFDPDQEHLMYGTEEDPAAGIDSQVHMAPIKPLEDWSTLPVVRLGHELGHSRNLASGTVALGETEVNDQDGTRTGTESKPISISNEELQTLDLENEIRTDLGLATTPDAILLRHLGPRTFRDRFYFRPPAKPLVETPPERPSHPSCDLGVASDSDGDGWGWENQTSCVVH